MTDTLTRAQRSERMSRIAAKDTKPERIVRSIVHTLGYRYRLHDKELPGRPDLAFSGRRAVIFVHGCLWHQHDCGRYKLPASNVDFWSKKLADNVLRDHEHQAELEAMGWHVLTVWECETRDRARLEQRLVHFLESHPHSRANARKR